MTKISLTTTTYFFALLLSQTLPTTTAAASDIYGPEIAFTSRYHDCCKPSCSWADKAKFTNNIPVQSCDVNNNPLADAQAGTGCQGGVAYACAKQEPWAVNETFSYGFVGAHLKGADEGNWCCACYELEFLDGTAKGKKMVVQASNTDYELKGENIFTFGIPAGNTSYADACATQYSVPNDTFGKKWEGIGTRAECEKLPKVLKAGCEWRFDWFMDAAAPKVSYKRVQCPKVLTDITQCSRADESTFEAIANSSTKSIAARTISMPSSSLGVTLLSVLFAAVCTSWIGII